MRQPVYDIDLPMDFKKLYQEAIDPEGYQPYKTHTLGTLWHDWRHKTVETGYACLVRDYLEDMIGTQLPARFFWQKKGFTLKWHADTYTKCSFNFILTEGLDPIEYEQGVFHYKHALIDTSIMHQVNAVKEDRIMFRLQVDDLSYEEVIKRYEEAS
tara:strand:- start:614 stop:1081 length:468 start_codon:yes stop_codon:yes gene_type:complete